MDPVLITILAIAGVLMLICMAGMVRNWNRRSKHWQVAWTQVEGLPQVNLTPSGTVLALIAVAVVLASVPVALVLDGKLGLGGQAGFRRVFGPVVVFGCVLGAAVLFVAGQAMLTLLGVRVWRSVEPIPSAADAKSKPPRKLRLRLEDLPPMRDG